MDYRDFKRNLLMWLLSEGKEPDKAVGYATATARQVSYKTDQFYRWHWDEHDGYTRSLSTEDAEAYIQSLIYSEQEYSTAHKATSQKCLRRLMKWLRVGRGQDIEWEPEYSFSQSQTQPRDYLSVEERRAIREVALEYGSIPHYNGLSASVE